MTCSDHTYRVRCIDWWENDQGFTSCCMAGNVYFYELYTKNGYGQRYLDPDTDFMSKEVRLTSVVNVPGNLYRMFTVGNDKRISSNLKVKIGGGKDSSAEGVTELDMTLKVPYNISQLCITRSGKNLIAGLGETGHPGSIQVYFWGNNKPLDKVNEVQAHSKPIERLRMTNDNRCLFSIGQDGMLCFFEVREGSRVQKAQVENELEFSKQILTESTEMEKYQADLAAFQQEMINLKEANEQGVEKKLEIKKQQDEITTLEQDIKSNRL